MWEWVIRVGAVILVSTLITILTPDGRLTGIVGVILAVITVFVIIQPLNDINFDEGISLSFSSESIEIDYSYANYSNFLRCEQAKSRCFEGLKKEGINALEIEIIYDEEEYRQLKIKFVKVFFDKQVINLGEEHIDIIDKVKSIISNLLAIEKEVVEVGYK